MRCVVADQQASGLNRDQTQAYAAAHAGLEKLTADLGDLFVGGHARPDPTFGREGRNLPLTVPVSFTEAALGAQVRIPTLAEPVTVKVPAGTASGTTVRVRGRGIETSRGTGDLLVTFEIVVPKQLDDAQRAAVEALAEAIPDDPRADLVVADTTKGAER